MHCSSCYGQKPGVPHVDFESSYNGPPISTSPRAGYVDWVILCSDCVESAHSMLPETRDVAGELRKRIADLEAELADVGAYADKLEAAVVLRPERKQAAPPSTKPRKPRYQSENS
jgi:hypothetical protein